MKIVVTADTHIPKSAKQLPSLCFRSWKQQTGSSMPETGRQ
ncbi:hypothetical protein [Thalassobacillus sp. C254]|nr:hypothetical protein [Thalassobacillus sp. C254]